MKTISISKNIPVFRIRQFCMLLAMVCCSLLSQSSRIKQEYIVAIDAEYAPYEFIDTAGKPAGFTVSLLNEIGKLSGITFRFEPMKFSVAASKLENGEIQLMSMIQTPERARRYEFSDPHSRIEQAIFCTNGTDITGIESLAGYTIALQENDIAAEQLSQRTDFEKIFVRNKEEGFLLLHAGKADAFVTSDQAGIALMQKYELSHIRISAKELFPRQYGFAAQKGNTALIALLNTHLQKLKASGKYQMLVNRWLIHQMNNENWWDKNKVLLIGAGVLLAAIALIFFIWNYFLRREVQRRTLDLRVSEKKFMQLFKMVPIPLGVVNKDGTIVHFNDRFTKLFGYTVDDVPTLKEWWETAYPDELYRRSVFDQWNALAAKATTEGSEIESSEYRVTCKNGKERIVMIGGIKLGENVLATFIDITESKQAEKTLRASEDRYRALAEAAPDMIFVIDRNDRVQYANTFAIRAFNKPPDQVIGRQRAELFPHDIDERQKQSLRQVMESGQPKFSESQIRIGERKMWISNWLVPLRDESGTVTEVLGISRDITERKLAEDDLEENKEKYRGLSEAAFDAIFISEKGLCIEQNQTAEKMFGYTPEEAIGRYGTEWIVPEDRAMVMKNMLSGHEEPYEATAIRKDGTTFPCMLRGKMMHFKGRNVRVTSLTDITERKKAEDKITQLSRAVEQSPATIVITDMKGQIQYVNPKFVEATGYSFDEAIGKNPRILKSGYTSKEEYKQLWDTLTSGKEWSGVFQNKKKNGELYWESATLSPILNKRGEITNFVGVKLDITERKRAEALIQEQVRLLDIIFKHSLDCIVLLDKDYNFIKVSESYAKVCGMTVAEFQGRNHFELFPSPLKDEFDDAINRHVIYNKSSRPFTFPDHPEWGVTYWDLGMVPIRGADDNIELILFTLKEVTEQKRTSTERERLITELQNAIEQIKTLKGIVPICANCKKIRDDKGYWEQVEAYVSRHTEAQFSHGICPDCQKQLYPDFKKG